MFSLSFFSSTKLSKPSQMNLIPYFLSCQSVIPDERVIKTNIEIVYSSEVKTELEANKSTLYKTSQSRCNFYCDPSTGMFKTRKESMLETLDSNAWIFKTKDSHSEFPLYHFYCSPGFSRMAIVNLIATEMRANLSCATEWQKSIKTEKLKGVKKRHGIKEALRWLADYEFVLGEPIMTRTDLYWLDTK